MSKLVWRLAGLVDWLLGFRPEPTYRHLDDCPSPREDGRRWLSPEEAAELAERDADRSATR